MTTAGPITLRSLRLDAGLDHKQLASLVSSLTGRPVTWRASVMWEFRGVTDVDTLFALSGVYDRPPDVIRAASRNTRTFGGPDLPRGRKRKSQ